MRYSVHCLAACLSIVVLGAFSSCDESEIGPEQLTPSDTTAPAVIADLSIAGVTDTTVTLSWTAPGDDSLDGTASQYDLRYDTMTITCESWPSAIQFDGEPEPAAPGEIETVVVGHLDKGTEYCFALKAVDEAGNCSDLSNTVVARTTTAFDAVLWTRTFGGSGIDVASAMAIASDGNIVLAGKTNYQGAGGFYFYILRTNASGDFLWDLTYGGTQDDLVVDVVATGSGGCVVAGNTYSYVPDSGMIYVAEINSSGWTVWEATREYSPGHDVVTDLDRTGDGGYVLAGQSGKKALLLKMDSGGEEKWHQLFCGESCGMEPGYDGEGWSKQAISLAGGEVAFIYSTLSWGMGHTGCGPPSSALAIRTVDLLGGLVWAKSYTSLAGPPVRSEGALAWNDGGLLMLQRCADAYAMVKFDSDGESVWETSEPFTYRIQSPKLLARSDGTCVFFGQDANSRIHLLSLDETGSVVGELRLGQEYAATVTAAAEAADGCILIAGYKDVVDMSTQIYLLKINSEVF